MPALNGAQVEELLERVWPGSMASYTIEDVGDRTAPVRMHDTPERLRPDGIIAGPARMALADCAVWVALLGDVGPDAMTVTVDLNINFFKPDPPADVIAETRRPSVDKRLATGDVLKYPEGDPDPIAHATVTEQSPARPAEIRNGPWLRTIRRREEPRRWQRVQDQRRTASSARSSPSSRTPTTRRTPAAA